MIPHVSQWDTLLSSPVFSTHKVIASSQSQKDMEQLQEEDLDRLLLLLYACQTVLKHFSKGNCRDTIHRHPNTATNANSGAWGFFQRHLEKLRGPQWAVKSLVQYFSCQSTLERKGLLSPFLEHKSAVAKFKRVKVNSERQSSTVKPNMENDGPLKGDVK